MIEVIAHALHSFSTIDQLNLPNLVGVELLARRYQLIKEAHRISPGAPDYSASDIFMGWRHRRSGVDANLSRYVAGELRDQAAVAKEARKAREETEARNAHKGGPRDRGRGRGRGGRGAEGTSQDP